MADVGAILEEELVLISEAVAEGAQLVLVEGESDRAAVEGMAARVGVDMTDVEVVAIAGATNVVKFLELVEHPDVLALCDAAEEPIFRKAFERHGLPLSQIFVCHPDLEGELIAALGVEGILDIIEVAGETAVFDRMRAQPAQRDRPVEDQLHRFIGTRSGRKIRYAGLASELIDTGSLPDGVAELLSHLAGDPR